MKRSSPRILVLTFLTLLVLGSCKPGPSVTLLQSPPNQVEILLENGSRIMIDVTIEKDLTAPPTEKDILLVTHAHPDHYLKEFVDSFPGQKIVFTEASLEGEGFAIRSIPSGHSDTDPISGPLATNYLFVIDTGSIRIAHLGDMGQAELTPEQLSALGRVDICFAQTENSFSGMTLKDKKGFNLMGQINPRWVFLTHHKERSLEYIAENLPMFVAPKSPLTFKMKDFPEQTTYVIVSDQPKAYSKIYNAKFLPGTR